MTVSIKAKLVSLIIFLLLVLVMSAYFMQSALDRNARMINQQGKLIELLHDTTQAEEINSSLRYLFLEYLEDPTAASQADIVARIDTFRDVLQNLTDRTHMDAQSFNGPLSKLSILSNHVLERNYSTSIMKREARTHFAVIDDVLSKLNNSLEILLSEMAQRNLAQTRKLQFIPAFFIIGGLLTVLFSAGVMALDIFMPVNEITRAMIAASNDAENAKAYVIHKRRSDEIGRATEAFNRLLAQVSEAIAQIRQTREFLEHTQRMETVGRMTGGIAHDFNNMLTVMTGNLELIERRSKDDPDMQEMITEALESVDRGRALTQRLLAYSRRQILQPEIINISSRLPDTITMIKKALDESGVEIFTHIQHDLWDVRVDPVQLDSALVNLCINARDAMSGRGAITLETANMELDEMSGADGENIPPGDYVMVAVSDDGCGISPEAMNNIFEPFYTTKDVGKGTGLGLSMVYGFTRQSGGAVTVYSEIDHGTVIKLYFPRVVHGHVPDAGPDKEKSGDLPGGSETILVVEDEPSVLRYVCSTLEEFGYNVLQANEAASAFDVLKMHSAIDLLLTDVVMPGGVNGEELAAEAFKSHAETKILYISGYTRDALADQGVLRKGVELLSKPFSSTKLLQRVRAVLDAHS
jgi:signal transduction histidine kinase